MERIGGYWKPIIIYLLSTDSKRYGEIRRVIPAISEKVLIQHLKQLEADGLLTQEAKGVVPRFVTYKLSDSRYKIIPAVMQWPNGLLSGFSWLN